MLVRLLVVLLGLAVAFAPLTAGAHPHIFIDAKATIVFDDSGRVAGIRHAWTFDEAFSVWQTQGLDTNGDGITSSEEMQELADDNIVGLSEYGFYTFLGEGNETLPLVADGHPARFTFDNNRSTLYFGVAPETPYTIRDTLEIAINDPEYYVAITFADASDVTLENAPVGCSVRLEPPEEMSEEVAAWLYSQPPDVTQLPPELAVALRGVQGAILLSCPPVAAVEEPGVAAPAADAGTAPQRLAEAEAGAAMPFGGPPPEPGFVLPNTGLLGWIAEQQREFYRAMTQALASLREDGNAFVVLGTLSFLYGVFHAAGPGHGKVVIGSYVVANERQVRRGIVLSFAAAMLQSAVAIAFVLVLSALLNFTALAMSEVANWIGIASYGLVALLGAWLIWRKLSGGAHGHHHHGDDHGEGHHHGHDHGHDHHHHVVSPQQLTGGWREQLGVVLAVGLRPCSGALVVLAFALSQDLLAAGIVSAILMGLGTGLTVAVLASLAVGLKGLARGMASANGTLAAGIVWWAELAGALAVFGFGMLLLLASL